MTIKAKPFIKWVGGKTQLIESIEKALPEKFAEIKNVTYISRLLVEELFYSGFYNNTRILQKRLLMT